jgi:hypothetical protein
MALCEFANAEQHAYSPTPEEIIKINFAALVVESRERNTPKLEPRGHESGLKGNLQLPLGWFTREAFATPGKLPFKANQAACLWALQTFIGRVDPAARGAVAGSVFCSPPSRS